MQAVDPRVLRWRRSGKVASGKRAARGHWKPGNQIAPGKGARNTRNRRDFLAPGRGANPFWIGIQWPRAPRLPLATFLPRLPARRNRVPMTNEKCQMRDGKYVRARVAPHPPRDTSLSPCRVANREFPFPSIRAPARPSENDRRSPASVARNPFD